MAEVLAEAQRERKTMKLFVSLVALLIVDLILVGSILVAGLISGDGAIVISYAGPLIVGAGILVALLSMIQTNMRNRSADFLESARELIERAYTTLAVLDDKGRPKNIRIRWLAAARFLRASEKMSESITEDSHKAIYREHREYWRAQFYDLIFPGIEGLPADYYAEKPEHMLIYGGDDRPPLSERSLAVLYRFVRWPAGFEDPIKDEQYFTEDEVHQMQTFGPRGLGNLLAAVKELKAKRYGPKP